MKMKIAVIGANGKAGRLIVKEAAQRGHEVTAIARGNYETEITGSVSVLLKNLFDLTYDDIKENEAIIDAFGAWTPETLPQHKTSLKHLADILSGKPNRLLVVGGAGSLYVDDEHKTRVMDTPDFPEIFMPVAQATAEAFDELRKRNDVNWTYLSPAGDFVADGERTGKYILGGERLTLNSKGESRISYADYAIAIIDEAESGKHNKKRFSVVAE